MENVISIDLDIFMLFLEEVFVSAYMCDKCHTLKQAEEAWEQFDFKLIKEDLSDRSLADK